MGRLLLVFALIGVVAGAAGAASPPGRADAIADLRAAIDEEQRALELLSKTPPRWQTADDKLNGAQRHLDSVISYVTTVGSAALERDLRDVREADTWARILAQRPHSNPDEDAAIGRSKLEQALK